MARQVPCLLAVVVSALLQGHIEQRGPVAEAVEPRLAASPARHPGLEFGAGEARALLLPSPPLVSQAAGVSLGLLGAGAGTLQRPRVVPHVWVTHHATVIPKVASRLPVIGYVRSCPAAEQALDRPHLYTAIKRDHK
jgi:hypothetical protein